MHIVMYTEDQRFSRMMHLEFSALGATVQTLSAEEAAREKQKADLFIVDAALLLRGILPKTEGETVLLGYPEELARISSQELTRYYVVVRPFIVAEFTEALFIRGEEYSPLRLRPPHVEHPSDNLALDDDARIAYYKGEKIELTQREFALLQLLLERKGEAISRAEILSTVFEDSGENTNVVDVYINYLRKKIDAHFGIRLISTVRGCGYIIRS